MPEQIDVAALRRRLKEWSLISVDSALLPDNQDEYDRVRHELFEAFVNAAPALLDVVEAARVVSAICHEQHLEFVALVELEARLARLQGSEVRP